MGEIFTTAYRDANALLRGMWRKILLLVVLAFLGGLLGVVASIPVKTDLGDAVVDLLGAIAISWLIAPYFVALYEFVRNRDTATPSRNSQTVRQFFAWSAVLNAIVTIPTLVVVILADLAPTATPGPRAVLFIILMLALWVFVVRIATLLPGAAAGRRMSIARAIAETRGHFWFIVGATILPVLPVLVVCFIASVVLVMLFGTDATNLALALSFSTGGIYLMLLGISVTTQLARKFALPDPPQ